jgi:hypothetical protein
VRLAPVAAGSQVRVGRAHHLDEERGIQCLADLDVGLESVGDHVRRVAGEVAGQVVGAGDREKQLDVGAQRAFARWPDLDPFGNRRGASLTLGEMCAGHGEVDGRHGRQPLGGGHEGLGLVLVVGGLGLPQQRGQLGQVPVVGHSMTPFESICGHHGRRP